MSTLDYSELSTPRRMNYSFVSEMLSDTSLPYDEFTKGYLLQHLVDLLGCNRYRHLQLKKVTVGSFNLLQVDGPIPYEEYSIPISICFLESYPRCRPNVWVNCPDNTIIRKNVTPCVASSGEISVHPYLQNWKLHDSNIVSLVEQLGIEFADTKPFASPSFNGDLSEEQTKLAKILIDNGEENLVARIAYKLQENKVAFFQQIIRRYPRHPDLAAHIKTKKGGVAAFIQIAKSIASKKFNVDEPSSSHPISPHPISPMHSIDVHEPEIRPEVQDFVSRLLLWPTLPYNETTKECIRGHLIDLLRYYPQLNVNVSKDLIQVHGDISYSFDGNIYKATIMIWLCKSYPVMPPHVFLYYSSGHYLRENVVHVTPGGLVYESYLQNWVRLNSRVNLVGLVSHLSAEFTCQPPLCRAA